MKTKKSPNGFIRKDEAAKFLGCTIRSVDNWMKIGLIPYYKFGRLVFFKESDLIAAIERKKVSKE